MVSAALSGAYPSITLRCCVLSYCTMLCCCLLLYSGEVILRFHKTNIVRIKTSGDVILTTGRSRFCAGLKIAAVLLWSCLMAVR
jgi:hypothetical protein